jgi:uncharacterized protein YvpB
VHLHLIEHWVAPIEASALRTRKVAVVTALVSLGFSVIAFAGGPLVAKAAPQKLSCTTVTLPSEAHQNVCHIATAVYLNAPTIHQSMPLDCESAALAVALQTRGFSLTQAWVFAELPKQPKPAVLSRERPVTWGDPYDGFVGNVYGSESQFTGYGVYYPPIAAVAALAGATTIAKTGWTTSEIETQIQLGHPVVVWTNFNFAYSHTSTWNAFDGRVVPYTTDEHAVTVVGFNSVAGTVTVVDVGVGLRRTISTAEFTAAIATFGGMGVAVW